MEKRPVGACACAALLQLAVGGAQADDLLCAGCQVTLGIGGTYYDFDKTRGIVAPVTFDWSGNRYELGVFRFTTAQYVEAYGNYSERYANPYWGFSLSRRWRLWERPTWGVYFGAGASYKTETDQLNSTAWNFAWQLAARGRLSHAVSLELAIRHWSNANIRRPNRGQDFATLALVF
ncbi:MAG TPA: acyloxyacyl hydrolase [Steroidobacteraceae bacterium]|jgi:hypothetical protein|nr:acyloxyacyl hydrolase [Steroidobacteraceae bacterium]